MTKNRISQMSPGPISRYGIRRRRTVSISASGGRRRSRSSGYLRDDSGPPPPVCPPCALRAGDHILERLLDLLLVLLRRVGLRRAVRRVLLVGEDELATGELRIILLDDLLHSLYRLDVAVVRGDLDLVLRLVDVVHPIVRGGGGWRPD